MQKFQLELLFHLIGIGSASGIIYKDNSVFLISDNSANLFEYRLETRELEKTMLFENQLSENIPKAFKADFEGIANFGADYYIFGSGSTENRNRMVQYNSKTKALKNIDLTNLYLLMQSFGKIKPEDFNIEGVIFTGETWYFLQRGNGAKGKNGIFTVQGKNLENDFTILFNKYKLPKIKGVQSSFTDAVLVDNRLYFLAAAENSVSTYEDGEVLGSLVGSINIETMKLESTQKISDSHKFEGITLYQNGASQIEFLLCEDNDTEALESDIYKLTFKH
jgi:hypothetical protein